MIAMRLALALCILAMVVPAANAIAVSYLQPDFDVSPGRLLAFPLIADNPAPLILNVTLEGDLANRTVLSENMTVLSEQNGELWRSKVIAYIQIPSLDETAYGSVHNLTVKFRPVIENVTGAYVVLQPAAVLHFHIVPPENETSLGPFRAMFIDSIPTLPAQPTPEQLKAELADAQWRYQHPTPPPAPTATPEIPPPPSQIDPMVYIAAGAAILVLAAVLAWMRLRRAGSR